MACAVLGREAFGVHERERPALLAPLLHNLLLGLGKTTVRLTAAVAALEG